MPVSAGTTYIDIRGNLAPYKQDLNQVGKVSGTAGVTAGNAFNKGVTSRTAFLKDHTKRLASGIGASFAAIGIANFVRGSVSASREAMKIGAQTTAVIKSTGGAANVTADDVAGLAESLSEMSGRDDELVQESENMLLTFRSIRNEVGEGNDIFDQAALAVTDMSVAMGRDAQSTAIQLGKALNDPIHGATALSRAGVQFTDQQKEQIKTLQDSGDMLGAQKIILQEVTAEFGGSAEAQATSADKASVAWENFHEVVGDLINNGLEPVLGVLTSVITAFNNAPGPVKATIGVLVGAGGLIIVLGKVATGLKAIKALSIGSTLAGVAEGAAGVGAGATAGAGGLAAFASAAAPVVGIAVAGGAAVYTWNTAHEESVKAQKLAADEIYASIPVLQAYTDNIIANGGSQDDLRERIELQIDALRDEGASLEEIARFMANASIQTNRFEQAQRDAIAVIDEFARHYRGQISELNNLALRPGAIRPPTVSGPTRSGGGGRRSGGGGAPSGPNPLGVTGNVVVHVDARGSTLSESEIENAVFRGVDAADRRNGRRSRVA